MLFVYTGWHKRATMHTCDHRSPAGRFSASSMCLLGFREAYVESSPVKLLFRCFTVEAPQQRRTGKKDWDVLDVFWGCVCILQLEGKGTKAVPNPQRQQKERLHHFRDKLFNPMRL